MKNSTCPRCRADALGTRVDSETEATHLKSLGAVTNREHAPDCEHKGARRVSVRSHRELAALGCGADHASELMGVLGDGCDVSWPCPGGTVVASVVRVVGVMVELSLRTVAD